MAVLTGLTPNAAAAVAVVPILPAVPPVPSGPYPAVVGAGPAVAVPIL